jgi:hypothetical protein
VEHSITEATLELRTNELTNARSELLKAKQDAEGAFDLASRIRAREEEGKLRERQLEHKARVAEEERRMAVSQLFFVQLLNTVTTSIPGFGNF